MYEKNLDKHLINMKETLENKTKSLLCRLGEKNTAAHFMFFPRIAKIGLKERKQIRRKLKETIQNHKGFKPPRDEPLVFKTGSKPKSRFASISISHCKNTGAFLAAFDKKISIGFDIEEKDRVTYKAAARIASKREIRQAPSPPLLWTAKEAAFKCFSDGKSPLFLKGCLIYGWSKAASKSENPFYFFKAFSVAQNIYAEGAASEAGRFSIAFVKAKQPCS